MMNRRQIALKLVLQELKIAPPNNIDDLHKLQWSIYLAQTIIKNINYSYEWTPKGPLSYNLQNDSLKINVSDHNDGWALDDHTKQKLQDAKVFLDKVTDNPEELRKFASVLFVKNTGQGSTPEEIAACLAKAGYEVSLYDISRIISNGDLPRVDRPTK